MIDIQELRIGNLVRFKTGDEFKEFPVNFIDGSTGVCEYRVTANVHSEYPAVICRSYVNFCSDLQPIPLTEDVLYSCGFSQIHGSDPQEYNAMKIYYSPCADFSLTKSEECDGVYYETGIEVKSVHQLMNLYFALTGKELEVQP